MARKGTIPITKTSRQDFSENPRKKERYTENITAGGHDSHSTLLINLDEHSPTWHQFGAEQTEERDATILTHIPHSPNQKNTQEIVEKYRVLADSIYNSEVQLFAKKFSSSSDGRWVEATMRKGTLKDRIAATSVVASTNPFHKMYAMDELLQMAGCSTRKANARGNAIHTNSRVAQLSADALQDLFLNTFLPPRRKLITLAQRPLYLYEKDKLDPKNDSTEKKANSNKKSNGTKKTLSPRILVLWRFEEMVKERYNLFLGQYLAKALKDGVEEQKIHAIRSAATLLRSAPEGEAVLLEMIVNKLGDPAKKVAAASGHELRGVVFQHPAMQDIIAREVQQMAHRPGLSSRAVYNAVTFLNQLKLTKGETALPSSLIGTYFRLFEVAVNRSKNKQENEAGEQSAIGMKDRILSALLTGVNRAHPYLPLQDQSLEKHIDGLYRIVHTETTGASTQALLLLFYLTIGSKLAGDDSKRTNIGDLGDDEIARQNRFYRALYSKVSQTSTLGAGKHLTMFFNLLYKSLKHDHDVNRILAFAKRIFSTAIHCSSAVTAASIFLINEVTKYHPTLLASYDEIVEGAGGLMILDPSKRDPRGALVVYSSHSERKESEEDKTIKRAPGWEISLALHHFHPSVRKFTSSIGDELIYSGDPLVDFALVRFLDRFAYRNPKSSEKVKTKRGFSVAERRSGMDSIIKSRSALPVNDPSFTEQVTTQPQDEFFHRFFDERARRDKINGIVRHKPKQDSNLEDDANVETLEFHALEEAEEADADQHQESSFPYEWDTDSDEEAFVDSLAEKILDDSMDPVDLDDEVDDDMDDESEGEQDLEGVDGKVQIDDAALVGTGDSFDDGDDDDDDNDDDVEGDDDAFMDENDDESDEEAPDLEDIGDLDHVPTGVDDTQEDCSDEMDMPFSEESSSDGDDRPKSKELPLFAPVQEFEEKINKSWTHLKRSSETVQVDEEYHSQQERNVSNPILPVKKKKRRS